ncbi:signal peptidase II, partial [Candidatus Liberibacter asiaticus]
FAVFNLADLFISIGTCIIIYDDIILQHRQKGKIDFPQ